MKYDYGYLRINGNHLPYIYHYCLGEVVQDDKRYKQNVQTDGRVNETQWCGVVERRFRPRK